MNQGYVYSKESVEEEELKELLEKLKYKKSEKKGITKENLEQEELGEEETYYFLRSPHDVSGIIRKLPDTFPTPEGQMFNANYELRWKKRKSGYDVLVLSVLSESDLDLQGFESIPGKWKTSDFKAYFYNRDNNQPNLPTRFPTQFPKGFTFKGLDNQEIRPEDISIGQRYFQDKEMRLI
ncbi:MAG: hypothetical protein AAF378_24800 [Cyanobacteria bacterium P01_A01_bin.84]